MVGWHHRLSGHGFEQDLEDSEGQGSLVCSSLWRCKKSDTTEGLNTNSTIKYNSQVEFMKVLRTLLNSESST